MSRRGAILTALALTALCIYLFVTAPPPLVDDARPGRTVSVDRLLEIVALENAALRTLYTKEVVGPGIRRGLVYDEKWLAPGARSGPLPAVMLRGIAVRLDRSAVPLGLFLGSDYAINRGNRFQGTQLEIFGGMRDDRSPRYFFDEGLGLRTAMFVDLAVAPACVECHSNHPKTPKTDWKLGDVMGATTWTYSATEVTIEELVQNIAELRQAFRATYQSYLDRARLFDPAPEIGARWPREGLYLPDVDTFMAEFARRASPHTIELLDAAWREAGGGEAGD